MNPSRQTHDSSSSGRMLAFRVLRQVAAGVAWERAWRDAAPERIPGGRERRFAHELASGALRLQARLDWALGPHLRRPIAELDTSVLVLLRLGAYQILEADGVAPHAAVYETVQLAKRHAPRAAGFVNAVLRSLQRGPAPAYPDPQREPVAFLSARHSHPAWLLERWLARFGFEATLALCGYDNRRPELCLRVNRRRCSREELLARLPGSTPGRWSDSVVRTGTAAFGAVRECVAAGLASVQDESGSLVAPLVEPVLGERVLDLAAAPGGKACHLAELLQGTGMVFAYDRSVAKLERVRENVRRLGLTNVAVAQADSRALDVEPAAGVVLDAPCSGLGVLGRRPDLRWRKQPADLPRLAALQSELLSAAARVVAPGGMLVYSVCTFEPEETAQVAAAFATAHPEFAPADDGMPRALRAAPGILYFLPQAHGIDGGFVARWRRRDTGAS